MNRIDLKMKGEKSSVLSKDRFSRTAESTERDTADTVTGVDLPASCGRTETGTAPDSRGEVCLIHGRASALFHARINTLSSSSLSLSRPSRGHPAYVAEACRSVLRVWRFSAVSL